MICRIMMPHRNDMVPETIKALEDFPREWNGITFEAIGLPNSNILKARNDLLWGGEGDTPFNDEIDLGLFWDSDNVGTIDDFKLMLDLEKPVVFGMYPFNKTIEMEDYFVGGRFLDGFPGCTGDGLYMPRIENKVISGLNLWGGLGFTLIRRKQVLKKIKYPYFDARTVKTPDYYTRPCEIVQDDVAFCMNLHDAGIPVVLDPRGNIKHIPRIPQETSPKKFTAEYEGLAAIGCVSRLVEKIKILEQNARG